MTTEQEQLKEYIREIYKISKELVISDIEVSFKVSLKVNEVKAEEVDVRNAIVKKKAMTTVITKRSYKRRMPVEKTQKHKNTLHREYTTSEEDISAIRKFFTTWTKEGKIKEPNDLAIIEESKGVFYSRLTDIEKARILQVFERIRNYLLTESITHNT